MVLDVTRKPGQRFIFALPDGSKIDLMVSGISHNRVRLCVVAPREVEVYPGERAAIDAAKVPGEVVSSG